MLPTDQRRVEAKESLRSSWLVTVEEALEFRFLLWRGLTASYEQSRPRSAQREQEGRTSSHFFFCEVVSEGFSREGSLHMGRRGWYSFLSHGDRTNLFFTVNGQPMWPVRERGHRH